MSGPIRKSSAWMIPLLAVTGFGMINTSALAYSSATGASLALPIQASIDEPATMLGVLLGILGLVVCVDKSHRPRSESAGVLAGVVLSAALCVVRWHPFGSTTLLQIAALGAAGVAVGLVLDGDRPAEPATLFSALLRAMHRRDWWALSIRIGAALAVVDVAVSWFGEGGISLRLLPSLGEDIAFALLIAVAIVYYAALWRVADIQPSQARVAKGLIRSLLIGIGVSVLLCDVLASVRNGLHLSASIVLFALTAVLALIICSGTRWHLRTAQPSR